MNDNKEGKSKNVKVKAEPSYELTKTKVDTKISQVWDIAENRFHFSTKRVEKRYREDDKYKVRKNIDRMRKKMMKEVKKN